MKEGATKLTSLLHDPTISKLSKLKRLKIALLLLALVALSDEEYKAVEPDMMRAVHPELYRRVEKLKAKLDHGHGH